MASRTINPGMIGERYGSHLVEARHIDYFVISLNNDMSNQLIVSEST